MLDEIIKENMKCKSKTSHMWSLEFSESLDRRGINRLTATCKTKRRQRRCFVAPPMAKLVFFSKFRNFEQQLSRFRISYLFWCDLLLFYGGRKEDPSFLESGRFPLLMVGEDGSYFGKGDLLFFLCNRFPGLADVRVPFYSVGGGETNSWENLYLYYEGTVW